MYTYTTYIFWNNIKKYELLLKIQNNYIVFITNIHLGNIKKCYIIWLKQHYYNPVLYT